MLSRFDLDELIMLGQKKDIFAKCQVVFGETMQDASPFEAQLKHEEYDDYLQILAAKHYLTIV